jgi:hypothetical protein
MREVLVTRKHRQIMTDTQRRQEGIDRTDLDPATPTTVSQFRGSDVIVTVRI